MKCKILLISVIAIMIVTGVFAATNWINDNKTDVTVEEVKDDNEPIIESIEEIMPPDENKTDVTVEEVKDDNEPIIESIEEIMPPDDDQIWFVTVADDGEYSFRFEWSEDFTQCTRLKYSKVLRRDKPPIREHTTDISDEIITEPTCENYGQKEYTAKFDNGQTVSSGLVNIPALGGHTPGDFEITKEPTCTEPGSKQQVCNVCGEILEKETIPAKGHVWMPSRDTSDFFECENCHIKKRFSFEWSEDFTKCTRIMYDESNYSSYKETTDISDEIITEPTCENYGQKEYTAKFDNGQTVSSGLVNIPALGHTPGDFEITKEPTCTEPGSKQQVCNVCGEILKKETIPAKGHDYDNWQEIEGEESCIRKCKTCSFEETCEHEDSITTEWNAVNDEQCVCSMFCTKCGKVLEEGLPENHVWMPSRDTSDFFECENCHIKRRFTESDK